MKPRCTTQLRVSQTPLPNQTTFIQNRTNVESLDLASKYPAQKKTKKQAANLNFDSTVHCKSETSSSLLALWYSAKC